MRIERVVGVPGESLLTDAAACIAGGGTLIFPTDTVYGIGCAAENDHAVEMIFEAKRRPADKPLAVHLYSPKHVDRYSSSISPAARTLIKAFWPGPLTIIVERRHGVCAAAARGGETLALRCPDDEACRAILGATGPLAATSANISGAMPYDGGDDVSALPDATLAIIAGQTKMRRESTVLDCSGASVRVVRVGALDVDRIAEAIADIAPLVR